MPRLEIDFARPGGRLRWRSALLPILGLLTVAFAGWQYTTLATERARLEAALAEADRFARRDRSPPVAPGTDLKAMAADVARANTVAARLGVPWEALFADLEASTGREIILLGFEPEADARRLRITGAARRYADVTRYLRRLEATAAFRNVFLSAHEVRGDSVTFTLTADWVRAP